MSDGCQRVIDLWEDDEGILRDDGRALSAAMTGQTVRGKSESTPIVKEILLFCCGNHINLKLATTVNQRRDEELSAAKWPRYWQETGPRGERLRKRRGMHS